MSSNDLCDDEHLDWIANPIDDSGSVGKDSNGQSTSLRSADSDASDVFFDGDVSTESSDDPYDPSDSLYDGVATVMPEFFHLLNVSEFDETYYVDIENWESDYIDIHRIFYNSP